MPTTFRTDIGDGILAVLDGVKAANPTLLRRTSRARPANIAAADLPAAFIALVDVLMDAFTAVPQFATGTIWSALSTADEEYPIGDFLLPAVRFTFPNISIAEGRT